MTDSSRTTPIPLNVALQGGGSHGAFTWGVLDRLLEDGRFEIAAVSGTSAGAMNAVALADGWVQGGAEGARAKLRAFWTAVGRKGRFSPVQRMPWDVVLGNWSVENSPGFVWYEAMSRMLSPYMANPLDINPLRDVVEAEIDFGRVRACEGLKLYLSATSVQTGKVRVFETHEIDASVVMASACLPHIFQAVEIDGVPYWDGGYGGNPSLFPFFRANRVEDLLLVQINPVEREGKPMTAREIQNRVDEITFNHGLLNEFRAIAFVKELIAAGRLDPKDYRDIRMHRIAADEALKDLTASSKIYAEKAFLDYLFDLGRTAAEDWLELNADKVGHEATLPLDEEIAPNMRPKPAGMGRRMREFLSTRKRPAEA